MTTHVTLFCSYEYSIFLNDNMSNLILFRQVQELILWQCGSISTVDTCKIPTLQDFMFSQCGGFMDIQVFWGVTPCLMVNCYDILDEHNACVLRITQHICCGTVVYQLTLHNLPGDFNIRTLATFVTMIT